MARGRPADPTRAKRGTGNRPQAGEAKVAKTAPTDLVVVETPASPGIPDAPADFTPEAQAMYRRVVAELAPKGLREADLEAVAMMCYSASVHYEARRMVAEQGVLVAGPKGTMIVNPLIKVARDEANTYLRLANEFGLTLAARLRLGLMQLAGESMLEAMSKDLDKPDVSVQVHV